jgi:phytoene synthase
MLVATSWRFGNEGGEMTESLPANRSYEHCERMARSSRSNFYPAFFLLPRRKRRAMTALYAFTRYTDDLADNERPAQDRRNAIAQWRAALDQALAGNVAPAKTTEAVSANTAEDGRRLLPALVDAVTRFSIPSSHLHAVIDGVEMDLDCSEYETFDQLTEYCHRVASAVGLSCIYIWGFRGDGAIDLARKCGIAFQLTNILRDLDEDAQQGRVYLPQEDLRRFGYSSKDLSGRVVDERFLRLMQAEIERATAFYHQGADLFDCLEPDGQRIFAMMVTLYHGLLDKISRQPADVFRHRIRLGRFRKLYIGARWMLLPGRRSDLP